MLLEKTFYTNQNTVSVNIMKPVMVMKDPEAFQLLADETRRKIIFLLRVKEMNVTQIASQLNLTPQAVYHHINKLEKAGMVEVTREERVGHLIESHYMSTAEAFIFNMGDYSTSPELVRDEMITILKALQKLGFKIEYDDKDVEELVKLWSDLRGCCDSGRLEELVAKLDEVDFITKQTVLEYAEILSMTDEQYAQQHERKDRFNKALQSLVKK